MLKMTIPVTLKDGKTIDVEYEPIDEAAAKARTTKVAEIIKNNLPPKED